MTTNQLFHAALAPLLAAIRTARTPAAVNAVLSAVMHGEGNPFPEEHPLHDAAGAEVTRRVRRALKEGGWRRRQLDSDLVPPRPISRAEWAAVHWPPPLPPTEEEEDKRLSRLPGQVG